jgi:hypothetical protein
MTDLYDTNQTVAPAINNPRLEAMAEALKVLESEVRCQGKCIDFDLFNLEFSAGNLTDISPERYAELARKISR